MQASPTPVAVRRSGPAATVPDAVAPPPGHPRFPLFDSLRAIAALAIVVVHTAGLAGGLNDSVVGPLVTHLDIGVTLFFVISGFLLYRPFVAARILGAPSSSTGDYARRRILRIFPAYWLAITVLAVFPGINGVFTGNWWVHYGLLGNYPIYTIDASCAADSLLCGIQPTWSLGVEVAFYAALPLFALMMARVTRSARGSKWFKVECLVLGLIGLVSIPITLHPGNELSQWLFYSPLGHGLWFALGMALAATSVRVQERDGAPALVRLAVRRPLISWALAGALYILASLVLLEPLPGEVPQLAGLRHALFGLIAALLIVPAVFDPGTRGLPRWVLSSRPLVWLGLVSYGIFLWHWPIVVWLTRSGVAEWWPAMGFPVLLMTTLAITLACASFSYYLLERPLMRFKYRVSPRVSSTGT